jgi:hypothetical protein
MSLPAGIPASSAIVPFMKMVKKDIDVFSACRDERIEFINDTIEDVDDHLDNVANSLFNLILPTFESGRNSKATAASGADSRGTACQEKAQL